MTTDSFDRFLGSFLSAFLTILMCLSLIAVLVLCTMFGLMLAHDFFWPECEHMMVFHFNKD